MAARAAHRGDTPMTRRARLSGSEPDRMPNPDERCRRRQALRSGVRSSPSLRDRWPCLESGQRPQDAPGSDGRKPGRPPPTMLHLPLRGRFDHLVTILFRIDSCLEISGAARSSQSLTRREVHGFSPMLRTRPNHLHVSRAVAFICVKNFYLLPCHETGNAGRFRRRPQPLQVTAKAHRFG